MKLTFKLCNECAASCDVIILYVNQHSYYEFMNENWVECEVNL